jgi:hypothetical protein
LYYTVTFSIICTSSLKLYYLFNKVNCIIYYCFFPQWIHKAFKYEQLFLIWKQHTRLSFTYFIQKFKCLHFHNVLGNSQPASLVEEWEIMLLPWHTGARHLPTHWLRTSLMFLAQLSKVNFWQTCQNCFAYIPNLLVFRKCFKTNTAKMNLC